MTMVLRSTPTLTFEQYRFYLNTELLNSLEDTEVAYNAFDIDLVYSIRRITKDTERCLNMVSSFEIGRLVYFVLNNPSQLALVGKDNDP